MKTLVEKATNISVFIFSDSDTVDMSGHMITVSGGSDFAIGDKKCKPSLMTLHENAGTKTNGVEYLKGGVGGSDIKAVDWFSRKYKYDGSTWTLNSSFGLPDLICPDCGTSISMPAKKCSNSECDRLI